MPKTRRSFGANQEARSVHPRMIIAYATFDTAVETNWLNGKGSPLRVLQRPRLRFRVGPPLEQISCTAESATFRKAARG